MVRGIIEGMGFGRGLGALDLSKDRIQNYMHMIDYKNLTKSAVNDIKTSFKPLLKRSILNVADELEQSDRQDFDKAVITSLNLNIDRQRIYDSLLALVEIRQTARM